MLPGAIVHASLQVRMRYYIPLRVLSSAQYLYLQDRDFEPLHEGAPLFESLDGEIVTYDGSLGPTVVPIFINEAAYYYAASGLGIMLTQAVEWPVPAA